MRGGDGRRGRGDAHQGFERESELTGGEIMREDGEEGVDVEGEVFSGYLC